MSSKLVAKSDSKIDDEVLSVVESVLSEPVKELPPAPEGE